MFNTSVEEHIKLVLSDLKSFHNRSVFEFNDKYLSNSILFRNGADWKMARAAQTHYFTSKNFRNLLCHFEKVTVNFLDNVENIRKQTKTDDLEIKILSKYYGLDCIAKVLFAIDIDSYKERETTFVKSGTSIGDANLIQAGLMTILPNKLTKYFKLQAFNLEPIIKLGEFFKKMIRDRKQSGIKYNDLSEVLQDAVNDNKVKLTENEVIGNILLSFFAGVEPGTLYFNLGN